MTKRKDRLREAAKPKAKRERVKARGKDFSSPSEDLDVEDVEVAGKDPGTGWVYGIQPVLEALKSREGRVEKIWIAFGRSGPAVRRMVEQARQQGIPFSFKDRRSLDGKAGTSKHQGVLALLAAAATIELESFLRELPGERRRFIALLDQVQDPQNLGAIIRTACAAGVEGLLLPKHGTCPLTPAAVKASAGAAQWVPLVRVGNAAEALVRVREAGFFLLGADPAAGCEIYEQDLDRDLCLVIGGEGKGLRPVLKKRCDELVSIPMIGPIDSMNASVAAGILFYEVVRQRRQAGPAG